jgi:hypothetical protein
MVAELMWVMHSDTQALDVTPQYEHRCGDSHFPVDLAGGGGGVQVGTLQFMVCMTE